MTKLLECVIERLRKMPDAVQDLAAQRLLHHVSDAQEPDELSALAEARIAFERGAVPPFVQTVQNLEKDD